MTTDPTPADSPVRKNARPTPPPGQNWCSSCKEFHPVAEFAWRNKAKGSLSSKCKKAQCEYSSSHYKDNKAPRTLKIRERSTDLRVAGRAHLAAAAEKAACWRCTILGTATRLRANTADGVLTPSQLINNDASISKINEVLQHPKTVWICSSCWGHTSGASTGTPRPGNTMTVKSAVLQVLDAVPRTQAETLALVEALGTSTTPGSLSVLLGKMVSRGEIDRPSRGRYTVTQE